MLNLFLEPATLLKRDSGSCFPVNIAKFLRTPLVAASECLMYIEFMCEYV